MESFTHLHAMLFSDEEGKYSLFCKHLTTRDRGKLPAGLEMYVRPRGVGRFRGFRHSHSGRRKQHGMTTGQHVFGRTVKNKHGLMVVDKICLIL